LDTIEQITKNAGLASEQSPCLELSKEVWEEPGLLSECPQCGENLKFNPFIVDNKKREEVPKTKKKFIQKPEIQSESADVHFNLGYKYWIDGKIEEAIQEYKEAIRIKQNHAPSHFNIGLAYKKLGSTAEAKYHFNRALELGYERAKKELESLPSQEKTKTSFKPSITELKGHTEKITTLAMTPDGRFAVSGSADRTVCVWNLPWRERIDMLSGHQDEVMSVAIQDNAKWLVSCSRDGSIRGSFQDGWNLEEVVCLPEIQVATICKYSQRVIYVDKKNRAHNQA